MTTDRGIVPTEGSQPVDSPPPKALTRDQVELIKNTVAIGASDDELKLFLYTAGRRGLDPLAQQIHFIKRRRLVNGQWESVGTIQVGIDGFRAIAERTGKLAGIKRGGVYEDGKLVAAWAKVWRHDWTEPAEETVRFEEYAQEKDGKLMGLWATKPETMLKKCAEAAALRMAFPQNLSGLYTPDEMGQADVEQPARLQAPPRTQPTAQGGDALPKATDMTAENHVLNAAVRHFHMNKRQVYDIPHVKGMLDSRNFFGAWAAIVLSQTPDERPDEQQVNEEREREAQDELPF